VSYDRTISPNILDDSASTFRLFNLVTGAAWLVVFFLTEKSPSPPSRFLPFASLKQKHRSGLQVLTRSAKALRSPTEQQQKQKRP